MPSGGLLAGVDGRRAPRRAGADPFETGVQNFGTRIRLKCCLIRSCIRIAGEFPSASEKVSVQAGEFAPI